MRFILKLALLALVPLSTAFASPAQTAVFDIQNMTCAMGKVTVKKAFQKRRRCRGNHRGLRTQDRNHQV